MGKSPPTSPAKTKLQVQQLTGIASQLIKTPKPAKPSSPKCLISSKLKRKMEDSESESESENLGEKQFRIPLSQVVSVCVKGWFQDTLREAKAGDFNMQVLVGQMYNSGYGVRRDAQKGRFWMMRASRVRSSVWKVSHKRPGYNASDSESDEVKDGS